jgi:hypothetical protein
MAQFKSLGGAPRPPTWIERERAELLREQGIENVYLEPSEAPPDFWKALVVATTRYLAIPNAPSVWGLWTQEMTYNGVSLLGNTGYDAYRQVVGLGQAEEVWLGGPEPERVSSGVRLAAIEHLLDVVRGDDEATDAFQDSFDDRAKYYRVGLRLEGRRFIPLTSEPMHNEVVEPTLLLLSEERFREVDGLYRKAFDRALSGDASGAITVATSAVEQMLRILMPTMEEHTLGPLAEKARAEGIIAPPIEAVVKSFYELRPDSDAHAGGTSDFDLAMLALHLAGTVMLYLSKADRATEPGGNG